MFIIIIVIDIDVEQVANEQHEVEIRQKNAEINRIQVSNFM